MRASNGRGDLYYAGCARVKLVIQIPCLNERDQLEATIADLPRRIEGIDSIEVLVVDDGSTDGTAARAAEVGVHHVVRLRKNRGLAAAFMAGVDAAIRLGADVIVNTDADNQYRGEDIARIVAPILDGRADVVVGDRQTDRLAHFSPIKRLLQRWGSGAVRRASGTRVADATSGFRALTREAAYRLFVHNRFSYTIETIVHGGRAGLRFENVDLTTNVVKRPSRLFTSIPVYLRRNGPVILRAYAMYRPVQTFAAIAVVFFAVGATLTGRFVFYYVRDPLHAGHTQSLVVGVGCVIVAIQVVLFTMMGELLAANRRLAEEVVARTRRIDAALAAEGRARTGRVEGVETTGATPWTAE